MAHALRNGSGTPSLSGGRYASPRDSPQSTPFLGRGGFRTPGRSVRKQRNVVVLGFSMVGKTAVCQRFANDRFTDSYEPTYENSFSKIVHHNGEDVEVLVKDTQGDDGESIFRNEYGLGYHGYVLVYSISSRRSLDILQGINMKILNLTGTSNVPRVLVGNKSDLEDEDQRQLSLQEGRAVADEWGCAFTEASAKTNRNIDHVFKLLLTQIDKAYDPGGDFDDGESCVDINYCCELGGTGPEVTLSSHVSNLVLGLLAATMLYGLAGMVCGLSIGAKHPSEDGDLLAYVMFGFGLITLLVAFLGVVGVRQRSPEFMRVYAFAMGTILLSEILIGGIVFSHNDMLRRHVPITIIAGVLGLLLEIPAAGEEADFQPLAFPHEPDDDGAAFTSYL